MTPKNKRRTNHSLDYRFCSIMAIIHYDRSYYVEVYSQVRLTSKSSIDNERKATRLQFEHCGGYDSVLAIKGARNDIHYSNVEKFRPFFET